MILGAPVKEEGTTMPDGHKLTVRHRRLIRLLRHLRESAELTGDEAASRLEWSASKLRRIETGRWKRPQVRDVRDLLDVYGVTDTEERERALNLTRAARQRNWWTPHEDLIGNYVGFEDEASRIRTFEPAYIPGLLQTEDYVRALLADTPIASPEEVEQRITIRRERQKLLESPEAPEFNAVIEEPVIRRQMDRKVMREQLEHLLTISQAQHVTVQVLPLTAGPHPGMSGSFVILDYPDDDDPSLVYLETATDGLYLEKPNELHTYRVMFDHLTAMSLSMRDSAELIKSVIADL